MTAGRWGALPLVVLVLVAALALPEPAAACSSCFAGDPSAPDNRGMRGAILFMLLLIGLVQVGFVRLFWEFRRRAKSLDERKRQLRVLRGGAR